LGARRRDVQRVFTMLGVGVCTFISYALWVNALFFIVKGQECHMQRKAFRKVVADHRYNTGS
jgi:hypothetical protein